MRHFTPKELQQYLQSGTTTLYLLDVREGWEFAYCQIADSVLIPLGQLPEKVAELDKNRETVVICHHGIRSRRAAYYLESLGFNNVINLEGGVERWAREVDPTMKRY